MTSPPSVTGARWRLIEPRPDALDRARAHGPSEIAARCMALRGFDDGGAWFAPALDHLHDPYTMRNMEAAVDRLRRALRDRHHLRVITDYDVDGTTSSLILQAALRLSGEEVRLDHHIPDRFREGYGFSVEAARRAARDGVDLIVTADIGVRDHAAVHAAREAGVDVLICDHHLPAGADVPTEATVLCPPQAGCHYPNPHLAACGVALKVAQALLADHPKRDAVVRSLLKLAAIGTVADMVPLTTLENRAIVALGLRALNHERHGPGLTALLEACKLEPGSIDEEALGFRVGPRINAAGRVAHATHVIDLLTARDPAQARALADALELHNQERRRLQGHLVDAALALVPDPPPAFVVVAGPEEEGWHRGVVGIVAARLKETLHRPVAVASIQGDMAVASVRSTPGVHAVAALTAASDLLVKFGGHPAAAGFTVPLVHLDALRARLADWVEATVGAEVPVPEREVDAIAPADALGWRLQAELARLGPFGQGNPEPRLHVPGVTLYGLRTMGREERHLQARLGGTVDPIRVLWWGGAEHAGALSGGPVDLLGSLRESRFNGRSTLELLVTDARAAR